MTLIVGSLYQRYAAPRRARHPARWNRGGRQLLPLISAAGSSVAAGARCAALNGAQFEHGCGTAAGRYMHRGR
jgi:hypothetical protein